MTFLVCLGYILLVEELYFLEDRATHWSSLGGYIWTGYRQRPF